MKLFKSVLSLFVIWAATGQGYAQCSMFCNATETFTSAANWTASAGQVANNRVWVNTAGPVAQFENLACGGLNRNITANLNNLIPIPGLVGNFASASGRWSCSFDFLWQSSSTAGPGLLIWGASETASNPLNLNSTNPPSSSTATSVSDLVGVWLSSPLNSPGGATINIIAKDGNNSYSPSLTNCFQSYLNGVLPSDNGGIGVSTGVTYRILIERNDYIIHLNILNAATGATIGDRYLFLPATASISNLQFLHMGNLPQGSSARRTTAQVGPLCFSRNSCIDYPKIDVASPLSNVVCNGATSLLTATPNLVNTTYVWSGFNGCSPTCTTTVNTLTTGPWTVNGLFTGSLTATTASGCSLTLGASINVANCLFSEAEDALSGEQTTLYPNPAETHFVLRDAPKDAVVAIYDMHGRKVMESLVQAEGQFIEIASLPAGLYSVQVHAPDGSNSSIMLQKK